MIPLPFVFAFAALCGMWHLLRSGTRDAGWVYPLVCLGAIALQMAIIGVRFGYGITALARVQPMVGVLIPPLTWLAFARPPDARAGALHMWPLAVLALILVAIPVLQDAFVASVALVYAVALIWLVRQGEDGVPWASVAQVPLVRRLVLSAVAILIATGVTDAVAAYAVMRGQGRWIGGIVAGAMALMAFSILMLRVWTQNPAKPTSDAGSAMTFATVEKLMRDDQFYRDADLTLSRIARKLLLPAKAVSRSVNTGAGMNVSQYINGFRVDEACDRLRTSDQAITSILFDVGFNTKSNFNREFVRVTGVTPSVYRKKAQANDK